MGALEIILLIAGVVIFIVSFLLPGGASEGSGINEEQAKRELHILAEQELQGMRQRMAESVDEAKDDAVEKAERSLERLTNEKIMAVNEYSDTVLEEIHKNHEEAMFLYDMLNSKHANIKDTVSKMDRAAKAAEAKKSEDKKQKTEDRKPETQNAETVGSGAVTGGEVARKTEKSTTPEKQENGANNNDRILELYRQGESVVTIAKELGLGVGEVQLVIDLYRA